MRASTSFSGPLRAAPRSRAARRPRAAPRAKALGTADLSPAYTGPRLSPTLDAATAFAPATVANLGPGFDWLGCAVAGAGDTVTARPLVGRPGEVVVAAVTGDGGRLSLDPGKNCAGVAAAGVLSILGTPTHGVELTLHKVCGVVVGGRGERRGEGAPTPTPPPPSLSPRPPHQGLPLGSGLGSSAASAAAAAVAVAALFGGPLPRAALVPAGLASEAAVSGFHADNIAPAMLGGFVLIRSTDPLDLVPLAYGGGRGGGVDPPPPLYFALVNPLFEAPTAAMRAALPQNVPLTAAVANCAAGGALVAAILAGDARALGAALSADAIVEPVRGPLIPGFAAVKAAALRAGAYGCTISGAGPTCVAVVESEEAGAAVAAAMAAAFKEHGGLELGSARVAALDGEGARLVKG